MSSVASHSQYVVPGEFASPTRDAVRHAIRNAEDLRKRIRDLTKAAIVERKLPIESLSSLTGDTIQGAAEALSDAIPTSRQSAMRQVLDGLADAYAGMADATRAGLEEARTRGTRLNRTEAKRLRHALATLEQSFLDATLGSAQRLSVQARLDLATVLTQMRGHGTTITPAAKRAIEAAERHWPELMQETVKLGAVVAKSAATGFLMGASGFLEGMAKALKAPRATPIEHIEPPVVTVLRKGSKPATKSAAKPTTKLNTKTSMKSATAKAASRIAKKPASKSATKPAAKSAVKLAPKPTPKKSAKPIAKRAVKSSGKPVAAIARSKSRSGAKVGARR